MLNNPHLRVITYFAPVIFCMGVIFYASSIPGINIPALFPFQDIIGHLIIFACLGFFAIRFLKNTNSGASASKLILYTVLFGIIYGVSDEFHQSFVPNRHASAFDVAVDTVGCFLGSLFYR